MDVWFGARGGRVWICLHDAISDYPGWSGGKTGTLIILEEVRHHQTMWPMKTQCMQCTLRDVPRYGVRLMSLSNHLRFILGVQDHSQTMCFVCLVSVSPKLAHCLQHRRHPTDTCCMGSWINEHLVIQYRLNPANFLWFSYMVKGRIAEGRKSSTKWKRKDPDSLG